MAIYIKLMLTALFWGGTFVAGRMMAPFIGPFSGAFLRFAMASLALMLVIYHREGGLPRLRGRQIPAVFILGLSGVFAYNFFFLAGLQTVTASRASLIIALNPVFLALSAALLFGDRLGPWRAIGILLSLAGAVTAITHGHLMAAFSGGLGLGELYIFGCVACWVIFSMTGKVVMHSLSPLASVTWSSIIGAALLLVPALLEGLPAQVLHPAATAWLGAAYLGIFGTVLSFTWYYQGIHAIGPARAGIFINLVPMCAIVLAHFILHERIDASLIVGVALVTGGIYLTNRR